MADLIPINKEIQNKIYDDLFSPSLKEAGKALQNVVGLVTAITLPLVFVNKWSNLILEKNLNKYEEKLREIPEEFRIKVQPEIGVPILEKLTYYSNEQLSNLFIELLNKASNKNEISKIHPKYIKIIENLSEDEAIILNYFNTYHITALPCISLTINDSNNAYHIEMKYFSQLNNQPNINFKENITNYIDNLTSLGIFQNPDNDRYLADPNAYNIIENDIKIIEMKEKIIEKYKNTNFKTIVIIKSKLELTDLGKGFLKAIFKN